LFQPIYGQKNKTFEIVNIQTELGDILVKIGLKNVLITSANFLRYIDANLFDSSCFYSCPQDRFVMIAAPGYPPSLRFGLRPTLSATADDVSGQSAYLHVIKILQPDKFPAPINIVLRNVSLFGLGRKDREILTGSSLWNVSDF
jgi:hypothetical protein